MTVKEFKEQLSIYNDDDIVMLSSDEEGNSYGELDCIAENIMHEDKNRHLGMYPPRNSEKKLRKEYDFVDKDFCPKGQGKNVITLYPK